MRIVDLGADGAVAVCDEELSPPIDLTPADRVMHRPNERLLRTRICNALGVMPSHDTVTELPGVLRIGRWQPKPAARFLVVLIVAATPIHFVELVVRVMSNAATPTIVLTLTRAMWSQRSEAIVDSRKIAVVPLDDVLELGNERWTATSGWDDYLGAFVHNAGIRPAPGFSTIQKKTRVARASGTAGKIKAELRQWYRDARKRLIETSTLVPPPTLDMLASACGVSMATVSRWLRGVGGSKDQELVVLWKNVEDRDSVRAYRDP